MPIHTMGRTDSTRAMGPPATHTAPMMMAAADRAESRKPPR